MKHMMLLLLFALLSGCNQKEKQSDEYSFDSGLSIDGEMLGADDGYIIENAGIADEGDPAAVTVEDLLPLHSATTNVLVVRTESRDGTSIQFLALEFPALDEGSVMEYQAGGRQATFRLFGHIDDETEIRNITGSIEGTMRILRLRRLEQSMGLNREIIGATGDMEIVVSDIENQGLDVPKEKKYATRYRLPIITLDEFARINQAI